MMLRLIYQKNRNDSGISRTVRKIGKQKVIWRYDPIFFSDRYTKEYHLKAFKSIAEALSGYTEKCVISFVDIYPKNKKNMDGLSSNELNDDELREFAEKLSEIAADYNIKIGSCAEKIDLDECGIIHNCCIDRELIEKLSDVNSMLAKTKISVKNVDALKVLK